MGGGDVDAAVILGFLHTVPALAHTFDLLAGDAAPGAERVHVCDGWLLASAIDQGVTPDVRSRVIAHAKHLFDRGADAVLVTCSSIGVVAEEAAETLARPVLRVDVAMARSAVALAGPGGTVAALATVSSTLEPTTQLLDRVATGTAVSVRADVVPGAYAARAGGDQAEHDRLIRSAVDSALRSADVIVLAQASMAAALGTPPDPRVLTSPQSGLAELLAVAAASRR